MVDVYTYMNTTLSTLNKPVYYEHFVTSSVTLPCYSWYVLTSSLDILGDTVEFDNHTVRVTAWANNIPTLNTLSNAMDSLLQSEGMRRVSQQDLHLDNGVYKRVFTYNFKTWEDLD